MKKVVLLLLFAYCHLMQSMDNQETISNVTDVSSIHPINQTQATTIPQYVYENCTQYVKYSWKPEILQGRKANASTISLPAISRSVQQAFPQLTRHEINNKIIYNCETYGWIDGIQYIEKFIGDIQSFFSVQTFVSNLRELNRKITRLTAERPGELRTQEIFWPKRELTVSEQSFHHYVQNHTEEIMTGKDFYLKIKNNKLHILDIKRLLSSITKGLDTTTGIIRDITLDASEVNNWGCDANGFLDYMQWMLERNIPFSLPQDIQTDLTRISDLIIKTDMHPIEKAALVWYELVKIHPFEEANKRTSKAVAALILLHHGYAVPLIAREDAETYTDILIEALDKNKPEIFVSFIAQMVQKTQKTLVQ